MLRYLTPLLAAATLMLAVAATAGAHPGNWHWTIGKAETYVENSLTVDDEVGLVEARCRGVGARWRGMFHHFRCAAADDYDRVWTFVLHPVSRTNAAVTNVRCDDSESDYYCP